MNWIKRTFQKRKVIKGVKDFIERIEGLYEVMAGGVLGGISTHLVLNSDSTIVLRIVFGIVVSVVLLRLILNSVLDRKKPTLIVYKQRYEFDVNSS